MPLLALALLLTSAFGHATWNYLAKGARNSAAFTFAFLLFSLVIYLPLTLAVFAWTRPSLGLEALGLVVVSGLLQLTYFFMLTQGYRAGDLSLVYPLSRGTGPVLSVIGAMIFFAERPPPLALAGAGLVAGGVLVMSAPHNLATVARSGRPIAFALATGMCIASYTLWDKEGVSVVNPVLYSYGVDLVRLAILSPLVLTTESGRDALAGAWRGQRRAVIGLGVLQSGGYMLVLAALTIAPVSYVAPAREVSILFGAVLGLRLLREPDPIRRLGGASAIVAGVAALALA